MRKWNSLFAPAIERELTIPLLHIADAVGDAILHENLSRVALLTFMRRFPMRKLAGRISAIALKRRAFGFRHIEYFRQVCGYLNSRYIKFAEALGT